MSKQASKEASAVEASAIEASAVEAAKKYQLPADMVKYRHLMASGLIRSENILVAGKIFFPLCYNSTSSRSSARLTKECLPIHARPGQYTSNREAFVFISTHGVIPGKSVRGISPQELFKRKDFKEAFQVEKLTNLLSVEKLTVSPPGIGLFTYDPSLESDEETLARSRSLTCGGYQSCLNQHLTATHDTFIAHVLKHLEDKRHRGEVINLEYIREILQGIYYQLKGEAMDKGIKANIKEMDAIFNELSLTNAGSDKEIVRVFLDLQYPSFIDKLVELNKYEKPSVITLEIQAKYDKLEELHEETADYKETLGATDRFFKTYTIKRGQDYINKLFGSTEEEASQPGLVYKINILNIPSDPNDPSSIPLPPVQISWYQEELRTPYSLVNYISTKQIYTYLECLGYERAVIVDATCSSFRESASSHMGPSDRRLIRKLFYSLDTAYGGKKHSRKHTRKHKRKHTRKHSRNHSRKYKKKYI